MSENEKEPCDKKSLDAILLTEQLHKPEKFDEGAEELKLKLLEDIRQTYNISVETSLENVKDPESNGKKLNNIRKCLVKLEETELDPYECHCIKTQIQNPANPKSTLRKNKKADLVDSDNYSRVSEAKKCFPISQNFKQKLDKSDNKAKKKPQVKNNTDVLRLNKHAKHLKAEVKDDCNKGTCANFRKQATNKHVDGNEQVNFKPVSSIEKGVLNSRQKQGKSTQAYGKKRIDQNVPKEKFKIAVKNESGKAKNQFTKLSKTKSGRLAIELDEDIIELIDKKSKDDPYLFISVKKTNSGNLLLSFDTKENDDDTTKRVTIRQTPSGTRVLDIHKTMINILKDTLSNKIPNSSVSKGVKKIQNETQNKNNILPSEDMKKKTEENVNSSLVSVCCKLKSDTNLTIKDSTNPPTIVDKENLTCYCPKAAPGSVCCKLKDDTDLLSQGSTAQDNPDASLSIKDKYFPIKPNKKADLSCTCPKCSTDRLHNKQKTNSPPKVLPKTHKEDKNVCPKPIPVPICCKQSKVSPAKTEKVAISSQSSESKNESDLSSELTQLYKQGNANIYVKVQGKNGVLRIIPTVVTKTTSGTIAIYGGDTSSLKDTEYDGTDQPVVLSKTASGTYFINLIGSAENVNAMLRKTPSGGILLIPKNMNKESEKQSTEDLFKVIVTGVTTIPVELPAVLKMTPSENYIILLDKEFEKHCKDTFNEFVGCKTECIVDLRRTCSGDYIIGLDTEGNAPADKKNALLVKSSSGNLKVLVRGPVFEALLPEVSEKSSVSSAKAFGHIITKLPASSREIHRENLRKSKRLDKKASSDTHLYEKVNIQENKELLSEPSAVLKRTESGQYSIVLNKESKKAFINSLQHYLTTNSEGLVPIRRSHSGEIIISLTKNNEGKANYGSLKITSSGNIYVLIDEEVIKDMSKQAKTKDVLPKSGSTRPKHVTELIDTISKAVATTCHASPDGNECNASKCICDELQLDTMDWSKENPAKFVCPKPVCKKVAENINSKHPTPRDEQPHIVIRPNCDCGPLPKSKFGSTEQCFYLIDSVCPFHKDRYNAVSNELLEISGLCKAHEKNIDNENLEFEVNNDNPIVGKGSQVWDSLNYLPPQLPSFLKNVNYR
uniref:Uncharacterized protein n=1 Tax=Heliothis virescens TaxID=7102 RepID=A0A2A4JNN8_HELVI